MKTGKRLPRLFVLFLLITMISVITSCKSNTTESPESIGEIYSIGNIFSNTASTEKGIYYTAPSPVAHFDNVMFLDYNAQREVYLCTRAECQHNDSSCTGYVAQETYNQMPMGPSILATEENLFLVWTTTTEENLPRIEILELDGSGRRVLAEFKETQSLGGPFYFAGEQFFSDNNYLFFTVTEMSLGGAQLNSSTMQLDINSGELATVCAADDVFPDCQPVGFIDNKLCVLRVRAYKDEATKTHQYLLVDPSSPTTDDILFECFLENYSLIDSSYIFYIDTDEKSIVRKNLKDQKEDRVYIQENMEAWFLSPAFDGGVFAESRRSVGENFEELLARRWFVDFDNESLTENFLKFPDGVMPIELVSAWGEQLCVVGGYTAGNEIVVENSDGELTNFPTYVAEYALINKEDYLSSNPHYIMIEHA